MMERKVAREFHEIVDEVINQEDERDILFQALKDYQQNFDLSSLLTCAKQIITNPDRLLLFEELRSLIPVKHQMDYDRMAPRAPTGKLRVIRLKRKVNENLGFSVRGGLEHGVGMYVSHVQTDSQAFQEGLRSGDEIVRVNGFTIDQAIHEEVLSLIKAKSEIVLKVRSIGMLPVKETTNDGLSWRYVTKDEMKRSPKVPNEVVPGKQDFEEVKLCIHVMGGSLGCSICSGPQKQAGIYIQSIRVGSLAQEAGLEVGDQIVDVNGTSFFNIRHSEAVLALKESSLINMTVWKGTGLHLFISSEQLAQSAKEKEDEEKVLELQRIAKEREKEKIMAEDKEARALIRKALLEDLKKKQAEKEEEDRNLQALIIQLAIEEKERKTHLKSTIDAEAEFRKQQEQKRLEGRRMTLELRDKKEQELMKKERLKEEERQKEREKRLEKEKLLLSSLQEGQMKELKREYSIKQDRVKQDVSEAEREKKRHDVQTPGAKRRPPVVVLRTLKDEEKVPTPAPTIPPQPLRVKSPRKVEKAPSYLGQKPVLLSPSLVSAPVKSSSAQTESWYIREEDFDPNKLFSDSQIDGRQILLIRVPKDGPLDLYVEGGIDSPLAGRIIVSDIFEGGAVHRHGGIHKNDQIMMVNGRSLVDVTLAEAQKAIQDAYLSKGDLVQFVMAVAPPKQYEDEVTYF